LKKLVLLALVLTIIFSFMLTGCQLLRSTTLSTTTVNTVAPGSGVLNLSNIDPTTLDPAVASESTSSQYILLIYSGLLKLDDKLEPVGDIAESWTVDAAGTTYVFKMRHDVKFQSGHAVTANDFKYSWERAANPATRSQTAATYLSDILGVDDVLAGRATSIKGVVVKDDYTLQVTIDTPKSYFLFKLSYPTTFVVDQSSVSKSADWWRSPNNGTGPFKLSQWTQQKSLTLARNESYYGNSPRISGIQYSFYSGMPMDLYETGDIDITGVSTAYIDAVMDQNGPFYNDLSISSDLSLSYIGFNCTQPPFDDVNIRIAFSQAIDKDKIVRLVYRSIEKKANGILPPGMPGYNPQVKGIEFNVEQAKKLIKASKYGDAANLPAVTLTTYGYGGSVGQLIQALVYQWQENLGVTVNVRQLDNDRYFYNTRSEIDQLYIMGWSADYPHPQDFLDILFGSNTDYNYGGYSNQQADSIIKSANESTDTQSSFALYQKAEQIIIDDAACVPLTFGMNYSLVKNYVKNYKVSPLGFAQLQDISIVPH
jgi:oligopeptide transport system substrate-binding protein